MSDTRPYKHFSQNFLQSQHFARRIVESLEIRKTDSIIEIGPGKGILSEQILKYQPAQFIAIEIDERWHSELSSRFAPSVHLIRDDFLNIQLNEFVDGQSRKRLKIIGNIPYHITSPIFFKLIDHYSLVDCAVIMTQREVANRLVSNCGNKEYGILSVIAQTYSEINYLFTVSKDHFHPRPQVDSAVLKMRFFRQPQNIDNEELFRRVVRMAFNYRRKMLKNALIRNFDKSIVYSLGAVDLDQRPEQLSPEQFKILANEINSKTIDKHGNH
ncbi:MAG: ribosomal RNA small subunit methyltransferase A [Caldithrix sp.]|nr:ribosomal RNA small subunit methyltransferase A [Caldithrix sp.]